jgi:hypothetical protein
MMAAPGKAVVAERLETEERVFETMESFHPQEPHLYLAVLGADAYSQGQGQGQGLGAGRHG